MVARSNLTVDRTLRCLRRQRFTRHDVIEPPTDVALAQVAPGCPPGKKILVIGVQRAPDIYQSLPQNALEYLSLFRPLSHEHWIALLRVNVTLGAGDIDVPTENQSSATCMDFRDVALHLTQKLHFGRKILAAVGNIDRDKAQITDLRSDDAGLIVKGWVQKARLLRKRIPPDMEADS